MPTKKKAPKSPKPVHMTRSEFHRLKGIEAKWEEFCRAHDLDSTATTEELERRLSVDADADILDNLYATNWTTLCALLELDKNNYTETASVLKDTVTKASWFRNLCARLHMDRDASDVHVADYYANQKKFAREEGRVEGALSSLRAAQAALGATYTWEGVITHIKGMTARILEMAPEVANWRTLCRNYGLSPSTSFVSVRGCIEDHHRNKQDLCTEDTSRMADHWKTICDRNNSDPTAKVMTAEKLEALIVQNAQESRNDSTQEDHAIKWRALFADRWNAVCVRYAASPDIPVEDLLARIQRTAVSTAIHGFEPFWNDLLVNLDMPPSAVLSTEGRGAVLRRTMVLKHERTTSGSGAVADMLWKSLLELTAGDPATPFNAEPANNVFSALVARSEGYKRWMALCEHTKVNPTRDLGAVLEQIVKNAHADYQRFYVGTEPMFVNGRQVYIRK